MEPPPRNASQRRSPSRPSFLAPTKASLARSHPDVLERALSRSPTRKSARRSSQNDHQNEAETRGFGLRDRKALRPSLTLTASPSDPLKRAQKSPLSFPSRRSSGLGAFAAPPRRVSKRISASDLLFQSPTASQTRRVEASVINTPEDQLASELGSATGATDIPEELEGPSLHDGFEEPDLPPTPTQLGLERPPGRPRGLLSSSPSMQHGKWGKRRATGDVEQSPSKLRSVDNGAEPEDLTEHVTMTKDTLFPESVVKKRKLKRELSNNLESLKRDIAKLEGLCEKLDQHGEDIEPYLSDLGSVLISADPSRTDSTNTLPNTHPMSSLISTLLPFSTKRPPKSRRLSPDLNPFTLDQKAQTESYLSALAPLKLTASSNILPSSNSDPFLERHQLVLSAPPPFPDSRYRITISYETNPETQSLVSLSAGIDGSAPEYLRQWTNTRLANPLLKLDVSGLCWGINRYWEASLSRARIWSQIEESHSDLIPGRSRLSGSEKSKRPASSGPNHDGTESFTVSDLRRILPHIERTSMLFESKGSSLGVILSCELTIDEWTGEPELAPSICISAKGLDSGPNDKVAQDSKKLFQAILSENAENQSGTAGGSDAQAIIKATDCVLSVLFGANGLRHGPGGDV
ncbi:uncharacterized protein BJX67DRAFT_117385 [Aspergillus lucknowensis]|uniref:Uncharacterized protein n=1 Tax=Aspergillus lucknowensis TaxID=176173 RepID=A0ABR4LQN8_9EURO